MIIIIGLIICSWVYAFIYNYLEENRNKRFFKFLTENADSLMNGGTCEYEGELFTRETKLVRYQFCVSVIVLTLVRATGFHRTEDNNAAFISCMIINILGGWWGIPWGPIRTIQCFIENSKAQEITVGQLILSIMSKQN